MNKYLEQLVNLSNIDREIDEFEPKIQKIKKDLQNLLDKENEILQNIETKKQEKIKEDLNIQDSENTIEQLSEKLRSIKIKSADIKTQKEAKALILEEELAREQIKYANEDIERTHKIIEFKIEAIEKLNEDLKNAQENVNKKELNVNKSLEELEKNRQIIYRQKEDLILQIPQKILEFYQKIKKWAKNTTVVPVKKQACYGCFMKLNNYIYAEIIKGEEIKNCPHCGRILYIPQQQIEEEV